MTVLVQPLGQGAALAVWLRRARQLSLPHAMVVEGPAGIGKTTVIQWLAAALLCPSDLDQDGPCGVCRTCASIAAGQHPDVHVIDRARDEKDRKDNEKSFYVVNIAQVRRAQETLKRHAVLGRARVLVVAEADTMEEGAQNALLKTLEEPGAATFLLLEATRPERLLTTVRSRCQRLRVLPLDDGVLAREIAKKVTGAEIDLPRAVALARGSLGRALHLTTERAVQLHDLVQGMLATAKGLRSVATASAVLEGEKDRRGAIAAARSFLDLLRGELRRRRDLLAEATTGAYRAGAEPWTSWLEHALAAEQDLDLMIPPEQVLVACLLQFES